MKSKIIAVSAIAAAFISILLTLGAYVSFVDLIVVVLSSIFVLLPIYFKSYIGCFLAYIAGSVLGFIFSGFNIYSVVFPSFLAFFGVYPIVMCLSYDKNFSKILFYIISSIWCVAMCYGVYFYYIGVIGEQILMGLPEFIIDNVLYFITPFGLILFAIFDRYVFAARILVNKYLGKIIK